MSSKLVRKGLELVCSDEAAGSKRRKATVAQGVNKRSKRKARGKDNQPSFNTRRRGMNIAGKSKKTAVDYTEQNLEYFRSTSWSIDKDAYSKILERQNKKSHQHTKEDSQPQDQEDSEAEESDLAYVE